jgi:heat shock protein HtpX
MYKHIAANKRNTVFIMGGFVLLIGGLSALFAWWFNDWTILIYAFSISIVYVLIQYFAANSLALTMVGAKVSQPSDNPRLYNIVENLSITTGLPMPKVYIIDDPAPNAFASGRDPQHAVVATTTGLLDIMDDEELTAVMAHEMSHVKNYDIRITTITFGLVSLIGLLSDIGVRMLFYGGDNRNRNSSPVGLIFALVAGVLAPVAAAIAQMAVSRQREYLADSSAAYITRFPEGMVRALKKLEEHARPMKQQNPATAAMFIANPLRKGMMGNLFSSHPPIEKRIARLENGKKSF